MAKRYEAEQAINSLPRDQRIWSVRQFLTTLPLLIDAARSSNKAFSYRNFDVRGAALGVEPNNREYAVFVGGNLKKRGQDKHCAEKKMVGAIGKSPTPWAAGLVIAATVDRRDIHDVTGVATPTLHPCPDACIPLMETSPVVLRDTIVYTTGQDSDLFQVFTSAEICGLYRDEEYDLLINESVRGRPNPPEALGEFDRLVGLRGSQSKSPGALAVTALLTTAK